MYNISKKHIHIDKVDSTNNYLKQLVIDNNIDNGFVVSTNFQTKGRGEYKNKWESNNGENLLFSIYLKTDFLKINNAFMLSKTISLGIIDYLNSINKHTSFKIKWPNDIYFKNKKIAGILIENSIKGDKINHSIVGIGININQQIFNTDLNNPISLKTIFNTHFNTSDTLKQILKQINIRYKELINKDFYKIDYCYFKELFRNDNFYNYKLDNTIFSAKIIDVKQDGQILLRNKQNKIMSFYFKEIVFL